MKATWKDIQYLQEALMDMKLMSGDQVGILKFEMGYVALTSETRKLKWLEVD